VSRPNSAAAANAAAMAPDDAPPMFRKEYLSLRRRMADGYTIPLVIPPFMIRSPVLPLDRRHCLTAIRVSAGVEPRILTLILSLTLSSIASSLSSDLGCAARFQRIRDMTSAYYVRHARARVAQLSSYK